MTSIIWFRQDLRLEDNPALNAALARGGAVVPVFIWSPEEEGAWPAGGASRWWLHQSLKSLANDLAKRGSSLIIAKGRALEVLTDLCAKTKATFVTWNRRFEPAAIARDTAVKSALKTRGIEAVSFNGALLFEPLAIKNLEGKPYKVFTQYWRKCLTYPEPAKATAAPSKIPAPPTACKLESLPLAELKLEPTIHWTATMEKEWTPGAAGALALLKRFRKEVGAYADARNIPGVAGTSRLSPYLHFGEISPRQIWHALSGQHHRDIEQASGGEECYLREIGWREFAHYLLYHFPTTPTEPLRADFKGFPWKRNARGLKAWQRGQTGFPLVDAGMRELWTTGWMHNRVRMVVASFLIKDLLLDWQEGARWFWDTLVDADLASNTLGWQWTAGCGADAAPFFRIFNPTTQGEKFDASGTYVRRWIPELSKLPDAHIHNPSEAPVEILRTAGVTLGKTYPKPIVDHKEAREAALAAFGQIRG